MAHSRGKATRSFSKIGIITRLPPRLTSYLAPQMLIEMDGSIFISAMLFLRKP